MKQRLEMTEDRKMARNREGRSFFPISKSQPHYSLTKGVALPRLMMVVMVLLQLAAACEWRRSTFPQTWRRSAVRQK